MRPLHIGLLVVGAALAGGLAVKMTEFQPEPVVSVAAAPPVARDPAPSTAPPAVTQPATQSEVIQAPKPSPLPDTPVPAPPPAYVTTPAPKVPVRTNKPKAPAPWASVQIAESKPLPVYNSPPQFVPEPAAVQPETQPEKPPEIAPVPAPAKEVLAPPRHVTLRTGTPLVVRIDEALSSERNAGGDTFNASLADPLVVDGLVIAERGARVSGRVINAQGAGHFNGPSFIELGLRSVTTSDGQNIAISTEPWAHQAGSSRGDDIAKIGGGAILGAVIGAAAGGGKGAAIGAGVGGAAGAGAAAATHARPASISPETIVRFRLASPVTITEAR